MESLLGAGQQEVQRPQPQDGEDVGGEDDERVAGHGEDGGDRVDGEEDVGALDHHQGERIMSARTDSWKLIRNEKGDMIELYDLKSDRGEKKNLAGKGKEAEKELNLLLDHHMKGQTIERTGSEKKRLKTILRNVRL